MWLKMFPTNCQAEKAFAVKHKIKFALNICLNKNISGYASISKSPALVNSVQAMLCVLNILQDCRCHELVHCVEILCGIIRGLKGDDDLFLGYHVLLNYIIRELNIN